MVPDFKQDVIDSAIRSRSVRAGNGQSDIFNTCSETDFHLQCRPMWFNKNIS